MWTITKFTLRQMLRQGYIKGLSLVMLVLFVLVSIQGVQNQQKRLEAFEKASSQMRQAWETQGAVNPHNSAHYGHIIFQPVSGVQLLDNGIRPYAGGMLRLEAHKQNTPAFSAIQQRTELSRFGDFSLAWVMQALMPLFLIFICFQQVSGDYENKTLPLIAAQGTSPMGYLSGKWLAASLVGWAFLAIGIFIQWAAFAFSNISAPLHFSFLLSWAVGYMLFFAIISGVSVGISALLKNSAASLSLSLSLWVLWMIVTPRLSANLGAAWYPFEHKLAFNKALAEDRQKGIDGHNPADERIKQFEDSLLTHYKVADQKDLPVNADGLIMQADEEYSNLVYDKHFARVRRTVEKQNRVDQFVGILNPVMPIRQLSMAFAQSDDFHYMELLGSAENYRRDLIKTLNEKMAYGGSKTGDWEWAPDSTWYATLPDFQFQSPGLKKIWKAHSFNFITMLWWLLVISIGYTLLSKRLFQF
jgi:ABC-2 type transport system permease protein